MRLASCLLPLCAFAFLACSSPVATPPEGLQQRPLAAKKGDLVISEIYPDPVGSTKDDKEWFEVHNTTNAPIDLDGWTFQDDKNELVLEGTAIVPPLGYAVIGQSKDKLLNGGIQVDAEYGTKIGLSSTADQVRLLDPDGVEIDSVSYDTVSPWPPKTAGAALQLDPGKLSATANDNGASWCLAASPFGSDGGFGTPGKANDACGSGAGGSGGAGAGGSAAGVGGAGGSAAGVGGSAGSGGAGAGGNAAGAGGVGAGGSGAGAGGSAGAGGINCQVIFHKIDLNQPDPAGAPKDAFEAVELRVGGAFQAGVTTLADCGVATLSPFDADADAAGVCGAGAGPYHELAIGDLVIPASRFVVVGNIPASDRPWNNADGAPSSVLKNGPDYLILRGPGGDLVDAVSYADNDAPDIHANCPDLTSAFQIPADTNTEDSPALNQVLVRCLDGWQLLPESAITWKSENTCGSPGQGGSGGSGTAGSGAGGSVGGNGAGGSGVGGSGVGGSGASGTAGSGEAGTTAAGGSGGGAGGSTGGGAGGSVSGGGANGGASSGAAGSQAGGPDGFEMNPAEDGDCSCQAPGARGPVRGAFPLLALGLLAARRRRRGA